MVSSMFEKVLCESRAFPNLLDELCFVKRVRMKKDAVEFVQFGQHVLPRSLDTEDSAV